ncbi:hypothetical protein OL16_23130 [Salmonella enterica subsp. enterica serovar Hadar]|uniref:Uncharacterized protein n=1 Tax=Salmonella enterica subsp. enterica serovar Typhi str. CT18 TaxID=220341 RepID=A0A714SVH6_SALTI|nr:MULTISPECIES: hypothetical protein [Enterobacteriaceae]EAB5188242.1 hypothetical protein [Salmonella enterica]EBV5910254.1 hypothetical protein [Salmonella enterica subsp. enterica serovar Hadar]EDE0308309.1 hypothetical protein [Salmonella enterica subsp. enterica serovar Enteritidis]EHQ0360819.1 hypothetical protein [Salmonella enterica subsp. enterica serovar 4,[5],12:i:-]HAB6925647.1 hypothetical protein [Salmonella enterica subsp. enterica serovar Typhi str. CT18]
MNVKTRTVFFVINGRDAGSLMMDVRIESKIGNEGRQPEKIYGYAVQDNAGIYVENNSYPIEWDSKKERFVVYIPPRIRVN